VEKENKVETVVKVRTFTQKKQKRKSKGEKHTYVGRGNEGKKR